MKDNMIVLPGNQYPMIGFYMVELEELTDAAKSSMNLEHMQSIDTIKNRAYNVYEVKSKKNLVQYYYKCCYSPVISIWIQAIERTGLTAKLLEKYLP